ncbi:MAG: pyridoxal phosphate-dependent aminotransferase [Candidatus Bipolaricaulia bacterium]
MLARLDSVAQSRIVELRDHLIAKQEQGERVYRLESGTPSFTLPQRVKEAFAKALAEDKTFYPEGAGVKALREALAEKLARKNGIRAKGLQHVVVCQGGMGALFCVLNSVAGEGDNVIVARPVWGAIRNQIKLSGARLIEVDLRPELGFVWDAEELEATIRRVRPKALVFVNPSNPTGGVAPRELIARLAELADRYGFYVVEDVAYEDIVYGEPITMVATLNPRRAIPVFSMSKSQNFSGLRLGYLYIEDETVLTRVRKLLLYTTNGINSITQWAAIEALKPKYNALIARMVAEYRERRDILCEAVNAIPIFKPLVPPLGAFYLFPEIDVEAYRAFLAGLGRAPGSGFNAGESLQNFLLEHNIGSIAGNFFGAQGEFLRFAYACSTDQVVEAAAKLREIFGVS